MEREEILAQSRKENKEQDLYEQESLKQGKYSLQLQLPATYFHKQI